MEKNDNPSQRKGMSKLSKICAIATGCVASAIAGAGLERAGVVDKIFPGQGAPYQVIEDTYNLDNNDVFHLESAPQGLKEFASRLYPKDFIRELAGAVRCFKVPSDQYNYYTKERWSDSEYSLVGKFVCGNTNNTSVTFRKFPLGERKDALILSDAGGRLKVRVVFDPDTGEISKVDYNGSYDEHSAREALLESQERFDSLCKQTLKMNLRKRRR